MDFFASQDKARGKTKILVFYYGLAMLMMMLIIYVVLAALLNIEATANPGRVKMERGYTGIQWFHLEILVMVVFGVSLVVSLSSFGSYGSSAVEVTRWPACWVAAGFHRTQPTEMSGL